MNSYDIDTRISNEGRVPLAPLVPSTKCMRAASDVLMTMSG
jgi:hypothetical protein